jgi:hypothetical protein
MDNKQSHLLLGYLDGLDARGKQLCENSEDAVLAYLARYLFVLNADVPDEPVYLASGKIIREILGENPCFKSYYDYWDDRSRSLLRPLLEEAAETDEPAHFTSSLALTDGDAMAIETMLIPVMFRGECNNYLLGISVPDEVGPFGAAPGARQSLKKSGLAYDALRRMRGIVIQLASRSLSF